MADDPELAILSSVVSRQAADLSLYASFVLESLAGALPPEMITVQRPRSLLGRVKSDTAPTSVALRLGDNVFTLRRGAQQASVPQASIAHVVRGITLSTDSVPLAEWSQRLAAALAELSTSNEQAAGVLSRLTGYSI